MRDCQFKSRLSAYHDAELAAAEIEAVNEHLPTCEICLAELAAIREVSSALSTVQPEEIRPLELARLHRAIDSVDDRSVLQLAGMLSAMAASVLIICMAWISQSGSANDRIAGVSDQKHLAAWESMALGGQPETPGVPQDLSTNAPADNGVAIDFMLHGIQGLSGHENR